MLVNPSKRMCNLCLVSPSLSFLKGVAKWKNLQDEVSYVLDCTAEAWWAHNPQVPGFRMDENGTLQFGKSDIT